MKLTDAFRKQPTTVPPDATLREAAVLMDRAVVGALVVCEGEHPIGIVTDRDIVVRGVARSEGPDARIDSVMTTDLITLTADADLRDVLEIFREHAIRRIPVVDGNRLVGLLSVDDLLIDLTADLADVVRPVTGQTIFGHATPQTPATV